MAKLLFEVTTLPSKTAYTAKETDLNPSIFIAVAAEGQEEVIYLEEIEKLLQPYGKDLKFIILNKHYRSLKNAVSHSHPNLRYELLEEWRRIYTGMYGISATDDEWLICDRDNESFTEAQYDRYIELSRTNQGFHFTVSNPAFQLWLLLHFISAIPVAEIESKPTCKKRIQCVEKYLRKQVKLYKHGSLDWSRYKDYVRDAINNCQQYNGYTIIDLKNKTGTNLYKLLEFIEEKIGKKIF